MSADPYTDKRFAYGMPCKEKPVVIGKLNCILHARTENRNMELCPYPSRAILKNEVHELILTSEMEAAPKKLVNNISYIAFFEFLESGMLWVGDRVEINGKVIGTLAGYDFTHMPNHMNIVIKTDQPLFTGYEVGFKPGDVITFNLPKES